MAAIQLLFVFALAALSSAFDYQPAFYPGPCPHIPPSANFQQKPLLNFWYATHFSNPSFVGVRCATNNITETENGVKFCSKFLNSSGHEEIYVSRLNKTNTPGVYDVSHTNENGTVFSGKQVFYFYEDKSSHESHESHESNERENTRYVFTWACVNQPGKNVHVECAGIQSSEKTTLPTAVTAFERYLKSHGSPIEKFHQVDNNNCHSDKF